MRTVEPSFSSTVAGLVAPPAKQDPTLKHERCVWQILKKHFQRYTPQLVEDVCGTTRESFFKVAEALLAKMPKELLQTPEAERLAAEADEKVYNVIQLIYRKNYEGNFKDYEFSRRTMEEHWRSGYNDAVRTLRHPKVLQRTNGQDGFFTFDLARDGRE